MSEALLQSISNTMVLVLVAVLRPLVMYLVSAPFDLDPMMRKVFVAATMLPVSSVIAVLARAHGADEEFASEAVGATTIGLVFALPVLLFIVNFV